MTEVPQAWELGPSARSAYLFSWRLAIEYCRRSNRKPRTQRALKTKSDHGRYHAPVVNSMKSETPNAKNANEPKKANF